MNDKNTILELIGSKEFDSIPKHTWALVAIYLADRFNGGNADIAEAMKLVKAEIEALKNNGILKK